MPGRTMALPIQLTFLALLSACLFGAHAQPYSQGDCSPGQIQIPLSDITGLAQPLCTENPCVTDNNPCLGEGSTCTPINQTPGQGFTRGIVCTCKPPYVAYNITDERPFFLGQCLIPGADPCNPNPCLNGGNCSLTRVIPNTPPQQGFSCRCPFVISGPLRCGAVPRSPPTTSPPTPPPTPTPALPSGAQGVCGTGDASDFPIRCFFNLDPQGRYVCCDNEGCNAFRNDNLTPNCRNNGFVPPGFGISGSPSNSPSNPPSNPPPITPPSGSQGVCGTGDARDFPTRCYFNSDPQGRYVCCDNQGCNGFRNDNLTPNCRNNGFVPPGFGVLGSPPPSTPPSTQPSGSQGVCGTGGAAGFPLRCYFNNDPQGRYVCCDQDGCNGFAPPDNLFPRCKTNGYAPPGFGI